MSVRPKTSGGREGTPEELTEIMAALDARVAEEPLEDADLGLAAALRADNVDPADERAVKTIRGQLRDRALDDLFDRLRKGPTFKDFMQSFPVPARLVVSTRAFNRDAAMRFFRGLKPDWASTREKSREAQAHYVRLLREAEFGGGNKRQTHMSRKVFDEVERRVMKSLRDEDDKFKEMHDQEDKREDKEREEGDALRRQAEIADLQRRVAALKTKAATQ